MSLISIVLFGLIVTRITALSIERVAFHGLGKGQSSPFPTMGVAFFGATLVLWAVAIEADQPVWIGATVWTGLIYAGAFGLYTAALAMGQVGSVSAWTNLTIILLWVAQPTGGLASFGGIGLFAAGAWLLMSGAMSRAVWMMVGSDVLFVVARLLDASHTQYPVYAYAASLFTSISAWMLIPMVWKSQLHQIPRLVLVRPLRSLAAAGSNAAAYLTLFALLQWLPPALVEAISALAGFAATIVGVWLFRERHGRRKIGASLLMTIGVLVLLCDHYIVTQLR